jgi:hypothetical protein
MKLPFSIAHCIHYFPINLAVMGWDGTCTSYCPINPISINTNY